MKATIDLRRSTFVSCNRFELSGDYLGPVHVLKDIGAEPKTCHCSDWQKIRKISDCSVGLDQEAQVLYLNHFHSSRSASWY